MLVKNAFSINAFERMVEEKFPQIDIIQVGNFTSDRGIVEYKRRLEHDDLTDIIHDVAFGCWGNALGKPPARSFDVCLYQQVQHRHAQQHSPRRQTLLPAGPAQVRGIVYNKTLFEEKGWKVPNDFNSFIALCQTIEASGIRSIQLGFGNSEVLDTAFVGYSYGNCFSTPADAQWLADYNKDRGSFGQHFRPALNTFQTMIDAGVWKKSDLSLTYAERETMLFNASAPWSRIRCSLPEGDTPSPAPPISRAHAFLQPRHLATGPASIWCVMSV